MENKVSLNGLQLFGYHGCLDEEAHTGANFIIDVHLFFNLLPSAQTDDLSKTVDYETAIYVVRDAFAQRAKLIETAAYNIILALKKQFSFVNRVEVTVYKPTAPISADFSSVSITLID